MEGNADMALQGGPAHPAVMNVGQGELPYKSGDIVPGGTDKGRFNRPLATFGQLLALSRLLSFFHSIWERSCSPTISISCLARMPRRLLK